ncbi:MAG: tetratricopeptide repeat protein [Candidatus Cloacimonadota bacterium]|nr:tetratricopeptide repeat protein [Candidatus Cloacimonadota bacterium]
MSKIDKIIWQAKYGKSRNWLEIKKSLERGIKEYPQAAELYLELGRLYQYKKLYKKAINAFQQALKLDSHNDELKFKIGNCFLFMREYQLALDYYLKIENDIPEYYYNRAFAYSKLGKLTIAADIIKKLISYNINSEIPYFFLAELSFNMGKYQETIKYVNIAENKFGAKATIFYLRGLAYYHQRIWLKAYLEFQNAAKMKFASPQFYRIYGITCEKVGKTNEAEENLLFSIKLAPYDPISYIELIKVHLAHDKVLEAYNIVKYAKETSISSFPLQMLKNQILKRMEEKNRD